MDALGHVNHASTLTLFEEARLQMLFVAAGERGVEQISTGLVVSRMVIDYHAPLLAIGQPVRVSMSVRDIRSVSFDLRAQIHNGQSSLIATAETTLVPLNLAAGRPRRLTGDEREFLAGWRHEVDEVDEVEEADEVDKIHVA
jgi:acyl-CoA thioester hydrolase